MCNIEVEPDGAGVRSCPGKDTLPANLGGTKCSSPTIATIDDGFAGFVPATTVQIANSDVLLQPFTLSPGGCQIGLVAPNTQFDATPLFPTFTFVKVELTDPGTPAQRSLILPVRVVFSDTNSCKAGVKTSCIVVASPTEHLTQCFE